MSAADRDVRRAGGGDAAVSGDVRALLADLRTYLQQRREDGMEWVIAPPSPEAIHAQPEVEEESAPQAPVAPPPAAAVEPQPPRPAPAAAREQAFARACEAFVADTLARIARHEQVLPAQSSIFAARQDAAEPSRTSADKARELAALAAEVVPCVGCKLHGSRTRTVFGTGNPDADLVLVGEAPGRDEDLSGEPFVGRAGQLLEEILRAIGFARDDVFICNVLKCRPPGNRDPEPDEVTACEPFLRRQLQIIEPRLVLCLGRVAAQSLLGTRAPLAKLRESVHFYAGIPVLATYHPAALLRNAAWKRPTWDDVRKARALHDALRRG
ncbi:MAG: uracil-DNA glycosylase [Candidatus Krumholzibacteriia bacterium]